MTLTPPQLPPAVALQLDAAADRHGVPRGIVRAVAWVESKGNQFAVSPKGAIGVMQLMPKTAAGLGVNPHDVAENIEGGVTYLAQLYKQFAGDVSSVLAAYNFGPGNVSLHKTWPAETVDYVRHVLDRAATEGFRPAVTPLVQQAQRRFSRPRSSGGGRSSDDKGGGDES
jgi:soluble lytic murein transglycosylase-like protein